MSDADRLIWAAAYAAAFVSETSRMKHGDIELDMDIAARAAATASAALSGLQDANFHMKLSHSTRSDYDEFYTEGSD